MNTLARAMAYVTAIAVAIILSAAPNWSAADADSHGSTLWGTWYVTFDFGLNANIPAVATFHRDGTLVTSDGSDFGGPPFLVQSTPLRGVWVRTGAGTFEGAALYLNGDVVTGELVTITNARLLIQFGNGFDHIRGTVFLDTFQCPTPFTCPDPLTADPDTSSPPIPFRGSRLRVELDEDDGDNDDD